MRRANGGLRGTLNTTTAGVASGRFDLNEVQIAQKNGTWPVLAVPDPYFEYVITLIHADGTNGANNNTYLDSGPNNFTVSVSGAPYQGTYSPFSVTTDGAWSSNFDGNDTISFPANAAPNSAFNFTATKTVTIEAFVNFYSVPVTWTLFDLQESNPFRCIGTSTSMAWQATSSGTTIVSATGLAWTPGVWYHIAYVRDGDIIALFRDGVRLASASYTSNWAATGTTGFIACNRGNTWFIPGLISNFRVLKGVAAYDVASGSYTVPTAPFSSTANTSILTCQSRYIADNSSNGNTLTVPADVYPSSVAYFNKWTLEYAPETNGASIFFDGTADYLSIADSANLQLGSGDFTAEGWFFPNKSGTVVCFYTKGVNTTGGIIFGVSTTQLLCRHTGATDSAVTVSLTKGWHHVAWVRNGSTLSIYLDGVSQSITNSTVSFNQNDTSTAYIGSVASVASSANRYGGHASGFRIVKGTAVYTSNFTPPTAPPTAITNTALLLEGTNAGIFDNSGKCSIVTNGNAQISTTDPKYGTGSMLFDGTGDQVLIKNPSRLIIGLASFTMECWIKSTVTAGTVDIFGQIDSGASTEPCLVRNTGTLYYQNNYGVSNVMNATPSGFFDGNWHHLALVRNSGTTSLYVDGVSVVSAADANNYTSFGDFGVGALGATYGDFSGNIDDFRITLGIARYTSNFTPPDKAFPNIYGVV